MINKVREMRQEILPRAHLDLNNLVGGRGEGAGNEKSVNDK